MDHPGWSIARVDMKITVIRTQMNHNNIGEVVVRSRILGFILNLADQESRIRFDDIVGHISIGASTDKSNIITTIQYQLFQWSAIAIAGTRVCTPSNRRPERHDLQIDAFID